MSDPYYKSGVVMAVAKKSTIKSLKDLRGKRVAIKTGTDSADYANSIKQKYGFTTVTAASMTRTTCIRMSLRVIRRRVLKISQSCNTGSITAWH